ncbi:hypothetical protein Hanom_Chr01g00076231 [Helianthus anomalus]
MINGSMRLNPMCWCWCLLVLSCKNRILVVLLRLCPNWEPFVTPVIWGLILFYELGVKRFVFLF